MGIVQKETGQGQAHHHAPVRDREADAKAANGAEESLAHWKCLGAGCVTTWALPPGEKPRG